MKASMFFSILFFFVSGPTPASPIESSQEVSQVSMESIVGRPILFWEKPAEIWSLFQRDSFLVKVTALYSDFSGGRNISQRFSRVVQLLEESGFRNVTRSAPEDSLVSCVMEVGDGKIVSIATVCVTGTRVRKQLCEEKLFDSCVGLAKNGGR